MQAATLSWVADEPGPTWSETNIRETGLLSLDGDAVVSFNGRL